MGAPPIPDRAPSVVVRGARPGDGPTIAEFNARLALETEGKALDPDRLAAGVASALADPDRLRYWLAEDAATGRVVGQAAVTREWTDWRNGWLWWYQSVYIRPEARRRGVFRTLHAHIRALALAAPDVVGLRLYVEAENRRAQETYQALGLKPGGYLVFEEIWPRAAGGPG